MSKMIDFTGQTFGDLTVICRVQNTPKTKSGYSVTRWLCRCGLCGGEVVYSKNQIRDRKNKNCGCAGIKVPPRKHGKSRTALYGCWQDMKDRCFNRSDAQFKNYGGRGITMCDEWLGYYGSKNFFDWALSHGYKEGLTIERIDVNGNYEPNNCCWIPRAEQANNKQNTIWVTVDGERMPLSKACRITGTKYGTAYGRYQHGKTLEEIFSKTDFRTYNVPLSAQKRRLEIANDETN